MLLASAVMLFSGCGKNEDSFDPSIKITPDAIDFSDALRRKVRSYFTDTSFCSVESATDPAEGRVIRIKSKNAKKDLTYILADNGLEVSDHLAVLTTFRLIP